MQFHRLLWNSKFNTNTILEIAKRSIYTSEQLSIEKYIKEREWIKNTLQPSSIQTQRQHLRKLVTHHNTNSNKLLGEFSTFVLSIENTVEDFDLLSLAVEKIKHINVDENVQKASIGMMLMKTLHYFQNDDLAQKFYCDAKLIPFFTSRNSNLVFFHLLYKRKKYAELLSHAEMLMNRLEVKQQKIARSIYVLIFATCYNQNTVESLDYARKLNGKFQNAYITQDHLIFLAALALNQNAPDLIEEYLAQLWSNSHVAIPNLRFKAALDMKRLTNALQILRSILLSPGSIEIVFSMELLKSADAVFKSCSDKRLQDEYQRIQKNIFQHGYVTDKSLETLIFESFKTPTMTEQQKNRMLLQIEFNKGGQSFDV